MSNLQVRIARLGLAATLLWPPATTAGCDPHTAPLFLSIGGHELRLTVSPWLNLMPEPVAPIKTRAPFRAIVTLLNVDSLPLPRPTSMDSVWVAAGKHQWGTRLQMADDRSTDSRLLMRTDGGPRWLLQVDSVDVAVRVKASGRVACLRAPRAQLVRAE